ncbi:MAG: hypothetical protein ABEJ94_10975 [Halorientalis sp.]
MSDRQVRDRPLSVWGLLASLATLGVRGVLGGGQFVLVPSGALVGLSTAELAGTPFADYLIPGTILLLVLGVGSLIVAYGLYHARRWAWVGSVGVAVALAAWVVVEGFVIGFGERLQYPNLVQALATLLLAVSPSVREYCSDGSGKR